MSERLAAAVIDSSALLCVALGEPAAKLFLDGFHIKARLNIGDLSPTRWPSKSASPCFFKGQISRIQISQTR